MIYDRGNTPILKTMRILPKRVKNVFLSLFAVGQVAGVAEPGYDIRFSGKFFVDGAEPQARLGGGRRIGPQGQVFVEPIDVPGTQLAWRRFGG